MDTNNIPPATEDDLKLDLEYEYRSYGIEGAWLAIQPLIRLAAHYKQEAEQATGGINTLSRSFIKREEERVERITTLEAALREIRTILQCGYLGRVEMGDAFTIEAIVDRDVTQTEETPDD